MSGHTSPCLAVRVNILQGSRSLAEVNVLRSGWVKITRGHTVHLQKSQMYQLIGSCISGGGFTLSTGLAFVADGRTVKVEFGESGFQIVRGKKPY